MPLRNSSVRIFDEAVALQKAVYSPNNVSQGIPGEPSIRPLPATVHDFLLQELSTPLLDSLWPWLWLVAKRSGRHLDALHVQSIKGRAVIPAEDPNLHLVTQVNSIYVKPIPLCLLNRSFWMHHLVNGSNYQPLSTQSSQLQPPSIELNDAGKIAAGFLRSYALLIRHRSDLSIALQHNLLPTACEWDDWSKFINNFEDLPDQILAKRYSYGQLRLSRLNWATRIIRPTSAPSKFFYHIPYWSIWAGIGHFTTPALFIFAAISLALSAMQVLLSVPLRSSSTLEVQLEFAQALYSAGLGLSIAVLIIFSLVITAMVSIPVLILFWQISWAFRHKND